MINKKGSIWNLIEKEREDYNSGFEKGMSLFGAILITGLIAIAIYNFFRWIYLK